MKRHLQIFVAILHCLLASGARAEFSGDGRTEDLCSLYAQTEIAMASLSLEEAKALVYPAYVETAYERIREGKQALFVPSYAALSNKLREANGSYFIVVALTRIELMSAIVAAYIEKKDILAEQIEEGAVAFVDIAVPTDDLVKMAMEYKVVHPSISILRKRAGNQEKWEVVASDRFQRCKMPTDLRQFIATNTQR